ncbi:hypothetical protein Tco_0260604 [Tanacetum coccineum]
MYDKQISSKQMIEDEERGEQLSEACRAEDDTQDTITYTLKNTRMYHPTMVICTCEKTAKIKTSWTDRNPGFNYGFLVWFDPTMCDRALDVIHGLLRAKNELEEDF